MAGLSKPPQVPPEQPSEPHRDQEAAPPRDSPVLPSHDEQAELAAQAALSAELEGDLTALATSVKHVTLVRDDLTAITAITPQSSVSISLN